MKQTAARIGTILVGVSAAFALSACESKNQARTSSAVIVGKEDHDPEGYLNDYVYLVADTAGDERFC